MTQITLTNTKPSLKGVEGGLPAEYTTTTYNERTVTYSSATQVYGGSDRKQFAPPHLFTSKDTKPFMDSAIARKAYISGETIRPKLHGGIYIV